MLFPQNTIESAHCNFIKYYRQYIMKVYDVRRRLKDKFSRKNKNDDHK